MTDTKSTERPFVYRPNTSDEGMIWQIFSNKDYDLRRLRRGEDLFAYWREQGESGKRPLIIDAGANIGAASVYFCREFPNAQIVAIEPDRGNFEILLLNAHGLPISCLNAAVTSQPTRVRLFDPGEGNCGFRTEALSTCTPEDAAIESVQINRIFTERPESTYPFIVKIDIEGAEDELFSSSLQWLEQTPLLIIELHDWLMPKRQTSNNFLKAISQLDRDFVYIGENVFSIDNHFS